MSDYIYENTDKPVTNCRKTWPHKGKVPCGQCQSCKDQRHSYEVSRNHEYGKFCKGNANNQCTVCTDIKRRLRVMFHLAGRCMKRCTYCLREGAGLTVSKTKEEQLNKAVKNMYRYFLHQKWGLWITHGKKSCK